MARDSWRLRKQLIQRSTVFLRGVLPASVFVYSADENGIGSHFLDGLFREGDQPDRATLRRVMVEILALALPPYAMRR